MNYRNTLYILMSLTLGNLTLHASEPTTIQYNHRNCPSSLPAEYSNILKTIDGNRTSFTFAFNFNTITLSKTLLENGKVDFDGTYNTYNARTQEFQQKIIEYRVAERFNEVEKVIEECEKELQHKVN